MIEYEKFTLENGLRCIIHRDESTPLATVNVMYDVGSKDETYERTGFAHLFEHLMFEGSVNIPNYDRPLEKVGGDNNAFTSTDITNYYLVLPANNIETAFWLESDRMLSLAFDPESLEVQRDVVVEEFKQTHLNRPYGDVMLNLRPLAYKEHSYQWPTIGRKPEHIEEASMEEVKSFFEAHYNPNNAILSVAGNVNTDEVKKLIEKWFGPIENRGKNERNLTKEPEQTEKRTYTLEGNVPYDAIWMGFHMPSRRSNEYYPVDLISDILSRGESSRFNNRLMKEQELFADVEAYVTGEVEEGLFMVEGKLKEGVSFEKAEEAIRKEIDEILEGNVEQKELNKVKNQVKSTLTMSETKVLPKALNLAFHELIDDADNINHEMERYDDVSLDMIREKAAQYLGEEKSSVLYYKAKRN